MLRKVVLPEPEGAGDGDELAFLHVQVERAQGVRFHLFGAVDLGYLAHLEHVVFLWRVAGVQAAPERGRQEAIPAAAMRRRESVGTARGEAGRCGRDGKGKPAAGMGGWARMALSG